MCQTTFSVMLSLPISLPDRHTPRERSCHWRCGPAASTIRPAVCLHPVGNRNRSDVSSLSQPDRQSPSGLRDAEGHQTSGTASFPSRRRPHTEQHRKQGSVSLAFQPCSSIRRFTTTSEPRSPVNQFSKSNADFLHSFHATNARGGDRAEQDPAIGSFVRRASEQQQAAG